MTARRPEDVVREFFAIVRSGAHPDRASEYMSDLVVAHQVCAEVEQVVKRTPAQYADHVRDMCRGFGRFTLELDEVIASGDRVYVRWTQRGHHLGIIDGVHPTGRPLVQVASCVYRLADEKIVEYWMQIDRMGIAMQLRPDLPHG